MAINLAYAEAFRPVSMNRSVQSILGTGRVPTRARRWRVAPTAGWLVCRRAREAEPPLPALHPKHATR